MEPMTEAETYRWLRNAADLGDDNDVYAFVQHLDRHDPKGEFEEWLLKAAELGNGPAKNNLGCLMSEREKDLKKAEHWFRRVSANRSIIERGDLDCPRWYDSPTNPLID